jgi:tRNA threonylcarbamoyl adenosine modification protein YeaZ
MLTLGIETSSPRGSVALTDGVAPLAELSHDQAEGHAERLLPLIEQLCQSVQIERHQLERIAVGLGPGSFTGLRVGIALAQGLALGLSIPVVGVPSLAALSWEGQRRCQEDWVGAVLDARRGELFFAIYDRQLRLQRAPSVVSREQLAAHVTEAFGERPVRLASAEALGVPSDWMLTPAYPSALAVAQLAGSELAVSDLAPLYLRAPDVKVAEIVPHPILAET